MLDSVNVKGAEELLSSVRRRMASRGARSVESQTLVLTPDQRVDEEAWSVVVLQDPVTPGGRTSILEDRMADLEERLATELLASSRRRSANDENMFDDQAGPDLEDMRDLVSGFVREELRGALGEQITRSVRKYVRQEVRRALAERGLDER